jgi:hypothetical protein
MNILEVYPNFQPPNGGVQRHINDICKKGLNLNHKPVVLCWDKKNFQTETINGIVVKRVYVPAAIRILRIPMIFYLAFYMLYVKKKYKIDLIHAHDYLPGLSACLAGLLSHTPTVVTFHLPVKITTYSLPKYLTPLAPIESILKKCFNFWVTGII